MSCHGELAWKFPVEKQSFVLILKTAENILSLQKLIFLYASKKVETKAFHIFLMQNLEHCQPQHGKNSGDVFGVMPCFGIEMETGKPDFPKGADTWLWPVLI